MASSKELRQRAWSSLEDRYWMAFFATLVSELVLSIGVIASNIPDWLISSIVRMPDSYYDSMILINNDCADKETILFFFTMYIISLLVMIAKGVIGVIIGSFINGPAQVGVSKYYIINTNRKPSLSEVFAGFKLNYMGNVKVMLLVTIKTFLWKLLLFIPGIIKSYEYAMVPYIVAENPEISSSVAFALSKEMMDGNKWRLFKLEFSFIGWHLLALCTCGLGSFFLEPYTHAARTEFYKELSAQA